MTSLMGRTLPREYTQPLPGRRIGDRDPGGCPCRCGLTSNTSKGFDVVKWAKDKLGINLHPWQKWLLIHGLELDKARKLFRFRVLIVLVARQNGKTLAKMALTLYRLYELDIRLAVGTAQDLSQAREVMNEGLVPMMLDNEHLSSRFDPDNEDQNERVGIWHKTLNDEYFRLDSKWRGGRAIGPHGPRYLIKALNRRAGRGLWDVGEVNIDELREQTDFNGWSAISKVAMAAINAQIWCMSNAGDSSSLLLNHLRAVALSGADPSMFIAEWSAKKGCDLDDPEAIAQANPSLGYNGGPSMAAIRSALMTDPPNVFRTEVLCQFVDAMDAAVDMTAWAAGADPTGSMDDVRERVCLCVEVTSDGAHVAAVAASTVAKIEMDRDGRTPVAVPKVRLEVVASWENTKAARRELAGVLAVVKPAAVGWFPDGPGAALSATMKRLGAHPIKGAAVPEACMSFADRVEHRQVLQPDDELLDAHMSATAKVGTRAMWMFVRGPEHTSAAWAAAGATYLALNLPDLPKPGPLFILPNLDLLDGEQGA